MAASLLVGVVGAVANAETASFSAAYWDVGNQRWRDTATTPYDADPIGSYDYATATVQLEYSESGPVLTCALTGSGLKPNFTYQVKLNGKPSYSWGAAGDDTANERLGFAGRWWLGQVEKSTGNIVGGWNSDDDEYLLWKSRGFEDDTYRYVFEGYLLFGYVVTDAVGDVSRTLTVDSSFHVLWKVSQRPPGSNDPDPVAHVFVADGTSDWYASSRPDETRFLYAEWEPTRALPGELSLPVGSYAVRIFLTEESFHENTAPPSSGRWATVMTHDDFRFAITPPPACFDGIDNDDDGRIDFDPVTFANPGDQFTPPSGSGDPGCFNAAWFTEDPQCQDGTDNDGDGWIDYDGGLAALGYVAANPDPQCSGKSWRNKEAEDCGLGIELTLLLVPLTWLSRRRSRSL